MSAKIVSIEQCRKLMNESGIEYSDEELVVVREFLYRLVDISGNHFQRRKEQESKAKIIKLNIEDNGQKSIPLCTGEYRRTG